MCHEALSLFSPFPSFWWWPTVPDCRSLTSASCVPAQSHPTLWNPRAVACQASLPMEFSRQDYWSGLPFPPPWGLPEPGAEPAFFASPAFSGGFFTTAPPGISASDVVSPWEYLCQFLSVSPLIKTSVTGFRPTLIPCGFIFTCMVVISAKTKWDFQMRSHSLTVRTSICLSGGYSLTPEWKGLKENYIEEVFPKKNVA